MFSRRTRRDLAGCRGNKHGEESKEHAILPKKKGDERDHSSANRPDQNTYLTWTVPDQ